MKEVLLVVFLYGGLGRHLWIDLCSVSMQLSYEKVVKTALDKAEQEAKTNA